MKILAGAVVAATMMGMSGCMMYPGVIQDKSKPIDQNGYTVMTNKDGGKEVSSTEFQAYVFGFSLSDLRGSPSRRLYQQCLDQAPGSDALIEYALDTKGVNLYWFGLQWFTLTGTPVKTKK